MRGNLLLINLETKTLILIHSDFSLKASRCRPKVNNDIYSLGISERLICTCSKYHHLSYFHYFNS